LQHDVSELEIGDTVTLEALTAPSGVTLLDDPETVIATVTPPRLQVEEETEIEEETELVAEGETAEEAEQQAEQAREEGESSGEGEGGGE
jgi:large subunit ribosomal protein L25